MKVLNQEKEINIKLDSISVRISGKTILDEINLRVKHGEMIGVLGKSGAGKSTLLRTIAGLLKPTSNTIYFNETDFFSLGKNEKNKLRKQIGFIPQQFKLIKESSVFENVMIGRLGNMSSLSSMLRLYPKTDRQITLDCINMVGLSGKENIPARKLSGGEQQRVAIARCLAQDPQIILADEPVASLDMSLVEAILEILDHENKKGKTIVFVMHNIELIKRFAKRMILMKDGKIVYDMLKGELKESEVKSLFD